MIAAIPDTLRQQFDDLGYVILKNLLPPEVIEEVAHEMEQIVDFFADLLMHQGKITDPRKDLPFNVRFAELFKDHLGDAPMNLRYFLHRPGLFGLFFHPGVLDAVEVILGPEIRLYPNYSARPKLSDWEGTLVLWHQDGGYTSQSNEVSQLRMVNVWSPLVPARVENGCMQFIPGTHKLGVVPHVARKHYLEIASDELTSRLTDTVDIECDPGDVVLFHNLLFHCGLPNRSGKIRWSLDWRYQDATQSTQRPEQGHIARSQANPSAIVRSSKQWADLAFH